MTFILALLVAPFILITFCFAVEVFSGLAPLRACVHEPSPLAGFVIVVPAHNEEAILQQRLKPLIEEARAAGGAYVLVVADNCTDATAKIARGLGAEVVERFEPQQRGKGYALAFARAHLTANPPDVVLIIDADCMTNSESIRRLVSCSLSLGRPCQAINLQMPRPNSSSAVQLSTFAFFIKNVIRQRGLQRLARRVQLLGTGMAFPWSIFAQADLATGDIVEDLKLGQELAAAGHPPMLLQEASVWSDAETERNTLAQRSRWEGGYLRNAVRMAPQVLAGSLQRGDIHGAWAGVSLLIPPLALLIVVDLAALIFVGGLTMVTGAAGWPVLLLFTSLISAGVALGLAWRSGGSQFVRLKTLVKIPLYVVWKLPIYIGLARHGTADEWLRTDRGEDT